MKSSCGSKFVSRAAERPCFYLSLSFHCQSLVSYSSSVSACHLLSTCLSSLAKLSLLFIISFLLSSSLPSLYKRIACVWSAILPWPCAQKYSMMWRLNAYVERELTHTVQWNILIHCWIWMGWRTSTVEAKWPLYYKGQSYIHRSPVLRINKMFARLEHQFRDFVE